MGVLNNNKVVIAAILTTAAFGTPAAAQDLSPITGFFTIIGTALSGPLGRAAGLVAVAGVGFAFLTGRMNWAIAASIALGLVIIFGAATILAGF